MDETSESTAAAPPAALTPRGLLTLGLAWLVPGSGHFLLGRRARGVLFCLIILASLVIGLSLDGRLYRMLPNQPLSKLATLGSMGIGAPYFILRYLVGYQGNVVSAGFEYGKAFILTAGLMNLLLVLDVWDIMNGRKD